MKRVKITFVLKSDAEVNPCMQIPCWLQQSQRARNNPSTIGDFLAATRSFNMVVPDMHNHSS